MKLKSLLIAFMVCFALSFTAEAQYRASTYAPFTTSGVPGATSYVVCANSATVTLTTPSLTGGTNALYGSGVSDAVTVSCYLTNASGTTAGKIYLQGTIGDGYWYNVPAYTSSYPNVTDTFSTSATALSYHWALQNCNYRQLRVNYIGSGTHSDTMRANFWWHANNR